MAFPNNEEEAPVEEPTTEDSEEFVQDDSINSDEFVDEETQLIEVEYVDDGADQFEQVIVEKLGATVEDVGFEHAEAGESEEDLPVAWSMPEGDQKVAVMIPKRGGEEAAPLAREDDLFNQPEMPDGISENFDEVEESDVDESAAL
jgi:hypothetical protein